MIQVFGTTKSSDTRAAIRFFKERRLQNQFIDLKEKEMSRGEFDSVVSALKKRLGSREAAVEAMADTKSKDFALLSYLDDEDKVDKLFECQTTLLKLPICRNGSAEATAGAESDVWKNWK
jgi:arsenate reductase-like glutaredoxin family protein